MSLFKLFIGQVATQIDPKLGVVMHSVFLATSTSNTDAVISSIGLADSIYKSL